ncbi:MAG: glutamate racemase [Buchnera aphidicola (Schlechtendalia peitan)]
MNNHNTIKNLKNNLKKNIEHNVLIFDSGLGGLSIYKRMKHRFPNINYIYICDNEAFPYGEKKESFIVQRCLKIFNKVSNKINITLAILACNTASVTSLLILQKKFSFPIIGITPNIKKAIQKTKNKIIGLLATKTTIQNKNIQNLIFSLHSEIIIKTLYNKELVIIAEKKLKKNINPIKKIKKILKPWIVSSNIPDTIILGCTHFNFLKHEIKSLFLNRMNMINSNIIIPTKFVNILDNSCITHGNIVIFSKYIHHDKNTRKVFNEHYFTKFENITL